jgi:hypothetical protein
MTGAVLALTSGALVALGAAPASAASVERWIESSFHGFDPPPYAVLVQDTRPAADQWCVNTYGFRARGVTPGHTRGGRVSGRYYKWEVNWRCDSN